MLACAAVACGEPDVSDWEVSRDTLPGGATRVVNTPPAAGVEPRWRIEEELRIGTMDEGGPAQFGQIKGLAVTSDDHIAVLETQAQEVRVFGPDGAHHATFGGKGAGPGELGGAWGLMRDGDDRLWVPDHRNDRMSVYDPAGGFVTSYRMPVLSYGFVWDGGMLDDGRIVKPSITLSPERRAILRIYGPDMTLVDSILPPQPAGPPVDRTDPPSAFYWEAPGGMPRGYLGVPWYPRSQRVFDPGGAVWTSPGGDPAYRVTRRTLRGDTTLVIETRRAAVAVAAAVRDSAIDAIRGQLQERGAATNQDWSKVPDVKPAVEGLFVAAEGRLWVRVASPADSLVVYDIYDRDGAYAGTAATPLRIYSWVSPVVRGDRFWAVVTDELDVQYVIRGSLRGARERS